MQKKREDNQRRIIEAEGIGGSAGKGGKGKEKAREAEGRGSSAGKGNRKTGK